MRALWGYVVTGLVLGLASCSSADNQTEKASIDLTGATAEAALFGEHAISTGLYERDLAISDDGETLVYTVGNLAQTTRSLVVMRFSGGQWSSPEILPFSGECNDIEPFFGPDDDTFYFASNRPLPDRPEATDYNLWIVPTTSTGWGEPYPLPPHINTAGDEFYASVTAEGHLYFTATYEHGMGTEDIFRSEFKDGDYQPPVALSAAINTKTYEFNAYVSPTEDVLIFSSFGRADGHGGGDLYLSVKDENGAWKPAVNMGPAVNSKKLDYCPFVDLKRGAFYFTSNRGELQSGTFTSLEDIRADATKALNGGGNLFQMRWDAVSYDALAAP